MHPNEQKKKLYSVYQSPELKK